MIIKTELFCQNIIKIIILQNTFKYENKNK